MAILDVLTTTRDELGSRVESLDALCRAPDDAMAEGDDVALERLAAHPEYQAAQDELEPPNLTKAQAARLARVRAEIAGLETLELGILGGGDA
ncbi:hypothetical protein [Sedimentitalea sp.]|uniref:hypothetical protein n=1 Tax=Sedimentitalea sp. TaxID=2048915 RepID=UPI0032986C04